ncbi:MAG: hypothetical protein ABSH12_06540 [Endomicrobiales bacterium]|jgi:hypothetical protein
MADTRITAIQFPFIALRRLWESVFIISAELNAPADIILKVSFLGAELTPVVGILKL